eukprot:scaffold10156_cov97-Cyclotella_meneghiniana.AAC.8
MLALKLLCRSAIALVCLLDEAIAHRADGRAPKALQHDCPLGIHALIASCCCCRIALALVLPA